MQACFECGSKNHYIRDCPSATARRDNMPRPRHTMQQISSDQTPVYDDPEDTYYYTPEHEHAQGAAGVRAIQYEPTYSDPEN